VLALRRIMRTITHWIDGKSWERPAERQGDVFNPATGAVSAKVALASPSEVDAAVASAKAALPEWRDASLAKRARVLFAYRELIEKHKVEIAKLLTAEHGKVASDALGEVNRGLEVVEFACGIPQLLKGEFSEGVSTGVDVYSIRQPLGVVAGITPFNFPAMVPMWMFAIAIACGNTFVLKPSEKDPSAANCSRRAAPRGGPAGRRVQRGARRRGRRWTALLDHPDVAAISFVGSTPIARTSTKRAPTTASACRPSAAPRTTWWCCPMPTSNHGGRRAVSARRTARPANAAWPSRWSSRWATWPIRWSTRSMPASRRHHHRAPAPPESEMGPLITREHRDRRRVVPRRREHRGRDRGASTAATRSPWTRARLLPRSRASSTGVTPR
jgi:malonate-semialdehyde dehydrogenase (acetylating)/methylmalonate-semialdehyde dehydrogenase